MGGSSSKRSEIYKVKEPEYVYPELFGRDTTEAVNEKAVAACRDRYPLPGTDKWYAIGDEKPLSLFESVAVLKE
eukprot:475895-Pyramimonas_sp.AAC.1